VGSANCGTPWSQTFSFDPFGNISKTGTVSFQPTYNLATNRFQSIPGGTPTYDANGNLTYDLTHNYTWDVEGKALSVDTVNLTYDALGRMVEQNRSGTYTQIVYAPTGGKLALMGGQALQKAFVPLSGGATAVYTSSGLVYYRHSDWLGGSRLASTPSRGMYYDVAYAPYGEKYADVGTQDLNFTGQNQDTASYLYDFLYREYHPPSSRWISPDPAGLAAVDVTVPQTWNRYAYVANSPLAYVDPDGTSIFDFGFGSSHGGRGSLLGYMTASMAGGIFAGVYGWGGSSCSTDGAPGSCSMAYGLLSSGRAAQCPNNDCSPVHAGGQWLFFGAWADGSSGYLPLGLGGFSVADIASLRLEPYSDCSSKGYRNIKYEVTGPNSADPSGWYVTEHQDPTWWAPASLTSPEGSNTDPIAGGYDDTIFGWGIGRSYQNFTISRANPSKSAGAPFANIIVRLPAGPKGADYGKLGIWHGGTQGKMYIQGNSEGWAPCE
jgi:RHS repeat-associated protein